MARKLTEASSNGRTADFGSAYEGSNPSASANFGTSGDADLERDELRVVNVPGEVVLVGLGNLPPRVLTEVAHGLRDALGVAWQPGPLLDRPAYAYNESRRQYHAHAILRRLAALRGGAAAPLVGICDADLFIPEDGDYVIGDADRDAGVAILSLTRLAGEPDAVRRRARVEGLSMLGRLLGLSACHDYRCAMFSSIDARDADRKAPGLCASCRGALEP